ncbi:hypothetical protein Z043_104298 [Scleropages formosus]|uniref:Large ribosomal subunit protein uL2 RNA-binding domain-containing protein n=1 Tax=Scleropages formosus TaxID=113540 RepID=A0A0P7V157_SCLFO|nr:hypothetical protein Z043_104298 [Scleropages formosus]
MRLRLNSSGLFQRARSTGPCSNRTRGPERVILLAETVRRGRQKYRDILQVTDVIHDPRREAPLPKVVFHDPYRFKKRTEVFIAAEGIHTRQFTCCGKQGRKTLLQFS